MGGKRAKWRPSWIILVVAVNVACSVGVVCGSKVLYQRWAHPVTAITIQQMMTWVYLYKDKPVSEDSLSWYLGGLFALNVAGSNIMLRYCSVGLYEIVMALRVASLVCVQHVQFKVRESRAGVAAAVAVTGFTLIGTLGSTLSVNIGGLLAGLIAVFSSGAHKAAVKAYLQQTDAAAVDVLREQLPATITALALFACLNETPTMPYLEVWILLFGIGAAAIVMNVTSFHIMKVSPMVYQLLAPVKSFSVVLVSDSWGDTPRTVSIVGAAVCGVLYMHTHSKQAWDEAPQRSLDGLRFVHSRKCVLAMAVSAIVWAFGTTYDGSSTDHYRIADVVARGATWTGIRPCKAYPGSLACKYMNQSDRGPEVFVAISQQMINATLVHVRLGDSLHGPDCWNHELDCAHGCWCLKNGLNYTDLGCNDCCSKESIRCMRRPYVFPRSYYATISPPAGQEIRIVAAHHKTASYERDNRYIANMLAYWKMRGYTAHVTDEGSADRDLLLLARAPVLIQGGGGYSGLAARVSKSLGNQVLFSKSVVQCPHSVRNMLCRKIS